MRRLARKLLRAVPVVLGVLGGAILVQIVIMALGGHAHPSTLWGLRSFERLFSPIGAWLKQAPEWAWISIVLVVNVPAAMLLTWALRVGGMEIRHRHRAYWCAAFWFVLVSLQYVVIDWSRKGAGF